MNFKLWLENEDYRGTHEPPTKEDAPLHDLTNTYPDDIMVQMVQDIMGMAILI